VNSGLSDIVLNGSLLISAPLAVLAGLVSFLSPCVLPLVPGYLGFVSGTASSDRTRSRMVLGSSLFVLGFTLVFVLFGALLGSLGTVLLFQGRAILQPIAGVLVIALGFVLIGQFSFLQKTIKPNFTPKAGLAFAPLLGIVFGLGWTPCIGPTLGGVLSMVLTQRCILSVLGCLSFCLLQGFLGQAHQWDLFARTFASSTLPVAFC
jgi:cytochrome c-type biogenesis protein